MELKKLLLSAMLGLLASVASSTELEPETQCAGRAKTFVLGFVGHSGSTALMSILAQNSRLFVPRNTEPLISMNFHAKESMLTSQLIFDKVLAEGREELSPGFKVRPGNIRGGEDLWQGLIDKYDTRLVVNYRENPWMSAVGLFAIRARNDLSSQMGLKNETSEEHCELHPELCRFPIDDINLFSLLLWKSLDTREGTLEIARNLKWPCLMYVKYEDFDKDMETEVNRIYDFLGVPKEFREPLYHKALPRSPCQIISNYQEICTLFWGCGDFQPYIEDPENGCFCENKPSSPINPDLCDRRTVHNNAEKELCKVVTENGHVRQVACSSLDGNDGDVNE
ncbi:hypothetical protein NDN08_007821 [Rhodosorus marinus]|uniref:Sulfotransferase domain-containing protein n=1 Tax=Rhodosorus marinus TaxID=101924 RepID=A0AAV8UYM3_9RHOD|nr:hypothetical protein NDN08_007821 [Rhodosorus marinus]